MYSIARSKNPSRRSATRTSSRTARKSTNVDETNAFRIEIQRPTNERDCRRIVRRADPQDQGARRLLLGSDEPAGRVAAFSAWPARLGRLSLNFRANSTHLLLGATPLHRLRCRSSSSSRRDAPPPIVAPTKFVERSLCARRLDDGAGRRRGDGIRDGCRLARRLILVRSAWAEPWAARAGRPRSAWRRGGRPSADSSPQYCGSPAAAWNEGACP
jgi:hypothetical protein